MAWVSDKGFRILMQDQKMSCGLCSCAMVINVLRNAEFSESSMVNESRKVTLKENKPDENYSRYTGFTGDRAGYQPTVLRAVKEIPTSYGDGTYGMHLAKILKNNGVNAEYGHGNAKAALDWVSKGKLLIIRVGEPGHWVVVVKKEWKLFKGSHFVILDPGENETVSIKGYSNYTYGRKFSPYWVKCSKAISAQKVKGVLSSIDMQSQRRGLRHVQV